MRNANIKYSPIIIITLYRLRAILARHIYNDCFDLSCHGKNDHGRWWSGGKILRLKERDKNQLHRYLKF